MQKHITFVVGIITHLPVLRSGNTEQNKYTIFERFAFSCFYFTGFFSLFFTCPTCVLQTSAKTACLSDTCASTFTCKPRLAISEVRLVMVMVSQFYVTSPPKGSYSANTGDDDCNVNSSLHSLRTALCESIRYQAKSQQNFRQDLTTRVRHGEAALYRKCK